jgi:uncharacterized radical SAM superfamily Fe-S cluster-containing enzyme
MDKTCPAHGAFNTTVSSDWETYQRLRETPRRVTSPAHPGHAADRGCPDDCGLCPLHDQHTCLAILEITSRCNLICPICLADARSEGRDLSLPVIASALHRLIDTEGAVTPLQLGGGEPTLHPELIDIVGLAVSLGFTKIEIESNGLLLARRPELTERLRDAGLTGVYLQMDGLRDEIHGFIRGRALMEQKLEAIENCQQAGLQVVLSVTVVPGVNDDDLWEMVRFGTERRLTGVNFQPVALSGRYPAALDRSRERYTAGHFMATMERQSGGILLAEDLMPLACPDPRCGLLAYVLIQGGDVYPLRRFLTQAQLQPHVADLSDWETVLRDLQGVCADGNCGCAAPAGVPAELRRLLPECDFFSIGYHGMMDASSFDLERAQRCCVHRLMPDGELIPFCLHNIKYRRTVSGEPCGAVAQTTGSSSYRAEDSR